MKSPTELPSSPTLGSALTDCLTTVPKPRRTSDATLVRRSQQGDRRAFSALLARYDWRLRGLAHALLLDRSEMDVALATGYLRAWRDVVRVDPKDDVAAWLYRVTYNACIDQLRRADDAPGAGSDAGIARKAHAARQGVAAGLATLPAAERVAVVLVDREGFSPSSAARILGMAEPALSATLESARKRLTPHIPEPAPTPAPAVAPSADTSSDVGEVDPSADGAQEATSEPTAAPVQVETGPAPSPVAPPVPETTAGNGSEPHDPAGATTTPPGGTTIGKVGTNGNGQAPPAPVDAATDPAAPGADEVEHGNETVTADDGDATGNGNETVTADDGDATGNGNDTTSNGATGSSGNGSPDRNRGKGRRARRRAQHAASRGQAESPAPRDDTT